MKNINHYFTLPNEIFCLGLSSGEIAVYSYLLRCENRKTYQCYPSYRTIGQALKMSQNTVRKYVQSLEDKHLILSERTEVMSLQQQIRLIIIHCQHSIISAQKKSHEATAS